MRSARSIGCILVLGAGFAVASDAAAQRIANSNKFVGTLSELSKRQVGSDLPYAAYGITVNKAGLKFTVTLYAGSFTPYVLVGQNDAEGRFKELSGASGEHPGDTAKLNVTFPAAGKYVIAASSRDRNPKGAYTLDIEELRPPEALPLFTVPAISFAGSSPPAGELKWFDFPTRDRTDYLGVWGPDGRTGYIVGFAGIHQTDDGGKTWRNSLAVGDGPTRQQKRMMAAIWGRSKDDVYAVGQSIQHSTDGGKSWHELAAAQTAAAPGGYASVWGRGDHVYVAGTHPHNMQSADRGATWTKIPIETSGDSVWGNDEAVFICSYGTVWASRDEGKSWSKVTDLKKNKVNRLWGIGPDVYGVGDDGLLVHHVKDRGWDKMKSPTKFAVDVWGTSASDFYVAGGPNDTVFHTRDGGKHWTSTVLSHSVYRLWGPSADNVYAVGLPLIAHGLNAAGAAAIDKLPPPTPPEPPAPLPISPPEPPAN